MPNSNALVIRMVVANKKLQQVYVDNGGARGIIYLDCFKKLGTDVAHLKQCGPLPTFARGEVQPEGTIRILVTMGDYPQQCTVMVTFHVVDAHSLYNIILGRDWLTPSKTICSVYHLIIKFPAENFIAVV